jgi:AraC-like DNA-binding protein/mannose-6-phosphate isomerase-like protein (cupin superfamily)
MASQLSQMGQIRRSPDRADEAPRAIIALSDEYAANFVDPRHRHRRAQLLYACAGVMSVVTDDGSFIVPPQRAVWIPGGAEHEVSCRGPVSLRTLYIEPSAAALLPDRCRVLEVAPFLRALILEAMTLPRLYDEAGRDGRVMGLVLEEIRTQQIAPLHAPMPADPRLGRVCRALLADPSHPGDLDQWAELAGMGRRTFTRLFRDQTAMSFAAWRQHVRLLEALSQLAVGHSVTTVAYDVGYDSPSAFTAMFRRTFGVSPSRYFEG